MNTRFSALTVILFLLSLAVAMAGCNSNSGSSSSSGTLNPSQFTVSLSASPTSLLPGNSAMLTATLRSNGQIYSQETTFSFSCETGSMTAPGEDPVDGGVSVTTSNGSAAVRYQAPTELSNPRTVRLVVSARNATNSVVINLQTATN
jgi:ABC-type transport system substrate-binding protein